MTLGQMFPTPDLEEGRKGGQEGRRKERREEGREDHSCNKQVSAQNPSMASP